MGTRRQGKNSRQFGWPSLFALGFAACGPEAEVIHVEPPPFEGVSTAIYVLKPSDGPAIASGVDGLEAPNIQLNGRDSDQIEAYALGFQCDSAAELGFKFVQSQWKIPRDVRVRRPDVIFQAEVRPGPTVWEEVEALPAEVAAEIGYSFVEPTPCVELEDTRLYDEDDIWLVPAVNSGPEGVVVRQDDSLDLLGPDGVAANVALSTDTPSATAFLADDGELWLYSMQGALWHAPIDALQKPSIPWVKEPPNPFFYTTCVPLGDRYFVIDGGPKPSPNELFILGRHGDLVRFDVQAHSWSEIIPPDRNGDCPERRIDLRWLGPGRVDLVRSSSGDLVEYDAQTGLTSTQVSDADRPVGAPQVLSQLDGFGILLATDADAILRRVDSGKLEVLADFGVLFTLFDAWALVSAGDNRLLYVSDAGVRVMHSEYGFCETLALDDKTIQRMLPWNGRTDRWLAMTRYDRVWSLRTLAVRPKDLCAPDPL